MTSSSYQEDRNGRGYTVVPPNAASSNLPPSLPPNYQANRASKAAVHPAPSNSAPPPVNHQANRAAGSNAPVPRPFNNHQAIPSREDDNSAVDCCMAFLVLLVMSLLIVVPGVIETMDTKKKPEFLVDSIVVSPLNISSSQLTANWTLGIYVKNRNKYNRMRYENLEVTVLYNNTEFLSKTTVPAFRLGPKHRTTLSVTPKAFLQGLSYSVPEKIAENQRDGIINFDVVLFAKLTFYFRIEANKAYKACLLCGDVKVGFPEAGHQGTMVAGPYRCSYTDFLQVD